jgi:hypothetical protein
MPFDPDEQLWFDKDARRRLRRKKKIDKKRLKGDQVRPLSRLNRGVYVPLILGSAAILKIMLFGGFGARTLVWDVLGSVIFLASAVYIIKSMFAGCSM